MSELLPNPRIPRVSQAPGRVSKAAIDKLDQLIIVAPPAVPTALWTKLPDGVHLRTLARRAGKDARLHSRLKNAAATGIIMGRLPKPEADGSISPCCAR